MQDVTLEGASHDGSVIFTPKPFLTYREKSIAIFNFVLEISVKIMSVISIRLKTKRVTFFLIQR